jgi:hypothetical protein
MASIFHGLKPAAQSLGITVKEAPNRGFAEVTQEDNPHDHRHRTEQPEHRHSEIQKPPRRT